MEWAVVVLNGGLWISGTSLLLGAKVIPQLTELIGTKPLRFTWYFFTVISVLSGLALMISTLLGGATSSLILWSGLGGSYFIGASALYYSLNMEEVEEDFGFVMGNSVNERRGRSLVRRKRRPKQKTSISKSQTKLD